MSVGGKGKILYGMHFYPGVAEYIQSDGKPLRVFLNEATIRRMDPTMAGRPVFVQHVDGVDQSVDEVKKEADGWVIESFFNTADGKHWAKFIVVSEKGLDAVERKRWRLSNCYHPKSYGQGGLWNGVQYDKEIDDGEYEHLAIVPNPRYDESVIMTPDEFKAYCEEQKTELVRLANEEGEKVVKLSIFKRTKVEKIENAGDLESMMVVLPKSGVERTIVQLVNDADAVLEARKNKACMANADDHVDMGEKHGGKMTVNDLIEKHKAMNEELEKFKASNVDMGGEEAAEEGGDEDHVANEEDDDEEKKKAKEEEEAAKKKNAADKKAQDKAKADAVRNAQDKKPAQPETIVFPKDRVALGKSRYGS